MMDKTLKCEGCEGRVPANEVTLLQVAKEDREEYGETVYLCNTCMKRSKHVSYTHSIFTSKDYRDYLSGKGK